MRDVIGELAKFALHAAQDFNHFAKHLRENPLSYDEPDAIVESLWGSEDWRKQVFGKKTVAKYNVYCFFFSWLHFGLLIL